jgi:hypothetical protein
MPLHGHCCWWLVKCSPPQNTSPSSAVPDNPHYNRLLDISQSQCCLPPSLAVPPKFSVALNSPCPLLLTPSFFLCSSSLSAPVGALVKTNFHHYTSVSARSLSIQLSHLKQSEHIRHILCLSPISKDQRRVFPLVGAGFSHSLDNTDPALDSLT